MTSARATATRCCSPAESWSGLWCSLPVRSTSSMTSRTRSGSSPRRRVLAGDREGQPDVLGHVEQRDQVERLEDEARPVATQSRGAVVGQAADDLALEHDVAGRRPVEAAEQLEQRALAAARRAHERDEFAGGDRQGDAAERVDGRLAERVALREVACLEDRGSDRSPCGWWGLQEPTARSSGRLWLVRTGVVPTVEVRSGEVSGPMVPVRAGTATCDLPRCRAEPAPGRQAPKNEPVTPPTIVSTRPPEAPRSTTRRPVAPVRGGPAAAALVSAPLDGRPVAGGGLGRRARGRPGRRAGRGRGRHGAGRWRSGLGLGLGLARRPLRRVPRDRLGLGRDAVWGPRRRTCRRTARSTASCRRSPCRRRRRWPPRSCPGCCARWLEEAMNIWWISAVATSSGYVFQPMFSPARWKQYPSADSLSKTEP